MTLTIATAAARVQFADRPWAVMPGALGIMLDTLARGTVPTVEVPEREARTSVRMLAATARGERERPAASATQVISLRGVITPRPSLLAQLFGMGGGLEQFREEFRSAMADDEVGSVVLDIDSPGGLVDLVPEVAQEVREARGQKQIVAVANTRAASAAYWLASQADELVVTPSGEVGSIGVYLVHTDFSGMNEQEGVARTYISAGKYKTETNPDEPLSDEAREHLQSSVDDSYGMFLEAVAEGRGVSVEDVRSGYGEGRTLPAAAALEAGMVDRVATLDEVVRGLVGTGQVREAEPEEPDDSDELALAAHAENPPKGDDEAADAAVKAEYPAWLDVVRPGH